MNSDDRMHAKFDTEEVQGGELAQKSDFRKSLRQVESAASLRYTIDKVKANVREFGTNLFLSDSALTSAIQVGAFFVLECADCILCIKKEPALNRVYYAADKSSLTAGLTRLARLSKGVLVADLVGNSKDTALWSEQFFAAGFSRRARLIRMQRLFSGTLQIDNNLEIEVATERDGKDIHDAITENFDVYSELIPEIAEIQQAAAMSTILLRRENGRLAALLVYERAGMTSILRRWLVLPGYRHTGIGNALMHRYFKDCADCRRFLLWVIDTNERAIALYHKYGYEPDSMVDLVVIKKE